jgi:hypothetical protein
MSHHQQPIPFNPDITEFFIAAGFEEPNQQALPSGLCFIKGNTAVQFWGDKIQVNHNNGVRWVIKKSYQGFDRKNMMHLMMLMDIMGVIRLADVKAQAELEEATARNVRQYDYNQRTNLETSHY